MIDILGNLKNLLRVSRTKIEGTIFRFHYSFTTIVLSAFCLIVTAKQYVGDPIDCIRTEGIPQDVMDVYCWIHTTYTVPKHFGKIVGKEVIAPGVHPESDPREFRFHTYYQWVPFVLFLEAVAFYFPRWFWKNHEGGKIQSLVDGLNVGLKNFSLKRQREVVVYLYKSRSTHENWARTYLTCEILALGNVFAQIALLDRFFQGYFLNYGFEVLKFDSYDPERRDDPMSRNFPRMTKCLFHKYGPSAQVETVDALCVLPLNIINEKIFIFLWFWYMILIMMTSVLLMVRVALYVSPRLRYYWLQFWLGTGPDYRNHAKKFTSEATFGDWFLVFMIGENVDLLVFRKLIKALATYNPKKKDHPLNRSILIQPDEDMNSDSNNEEEADSGIKEKLIQNVPSTESPHTGSRMA